MVYLYCSENQCYTDNEEKIHNKYAVKSLTADVLSPTCICKKSNEGYQKASIIINSDDACCRL